MTQEHTQPVGDIDELLVELHKLWGFCNDDKCTARCVSTNNQTRAIIKRFIVQRGTQE